MTFNEDIGVKPLTNPSDDDKFCEDDDPGALLPNPSRALTTGYFGLIFCGPPKPGKCHHGYKGILSPPGCPALNGIKRDNTSLSIHNKALSLVKKATVSSATNNCLEDLCG